MVAMNASERVSKEWLTGAFPIETQLVNDLLVAVGWSVGSRNDSGVITRMRVLEMGPESFIAEVAQGEAGVDEVRYCTGVGVPLESVEHLDQLVASFRLEYTR